MNPPDELMNPADAEELQIRLSGSGGQGLQLCAALLRHRRFSRCSLCGETEHDQQKDGLQILHGLPPLLLLVRRVFHYTGHGQNRHLSKVTGCHNAKNKNARQCRAFGGQNLAGSAVQVRITPQDSHIRSDPA